MPFFGRPFDGEYPLGNLFDHDKPTYPDTNGYVISMCGVRATQQTDGHNGYDWRMPEGTRIFAVAEGSVMVAGLEAPFFCPPMNRDVQALYVQLLHRAPDGSDVISIYGHLSRVDVTAGQAVAAGTVVGLSGNTGCSGTPHLHFGAFRGRAGNFTVIDPYGWHATTKDPWEEDASGAVSPWLWRDGAAPGLTWRGATGGF